MKMVAKIYRRLTPRAFAIAAVLLTVVLCLYYANLTTDVPNSGQSRNRAEIIATPLKSRQKAKTKDGMCPKLPQSHTDVDTVQIYKEFDFQVSFKFTLEGCSDISGIFSAFKPSMAFKTTFVA